jgi:hypothetical protein
LAPTVIPRGPHRDSKGFLEPTWIRHVDATTRQKHSRTVIRYQTDLTDTEWRVIAPHLPKPCAVGRPCRCLPFVLTFSSVPATHSAK